MISSCVYHSFLTLTDPCFPQDSWLYSELIFFFVLRFAFLSFDQFNMKLSPFILFCSYLPRCIVWNHIYVMKLSFPLLNIIQIFQMNLTNNMNKGSYLSVPITKWLLTCNSVMVQCGSKRLHYTCSHDNTPHLLFTTALCTRVTTSGQHRTGQELSGSAGAGVCRWRRTGTGTGPGSPGGDPGSKAGHADIVLVSLTCCCCSGSWACLCSFLDTDIKK